MDIFSPDKMHAFFTQILVQKRDIGEWRMIQVIVPSADGKTVDIRVAAERLQNAFNDKEGGIYIESDHQILVMMKGGHGYSFKKFETDMAENLKGFKAKIKLLPAEQEQLKKFEVTLMEESDVVLQKAQRQEKVIMVVDDDLFIRSLIGNAVKRYGNVIQEEGGSGVVETYKKELPDIVFLDIHLPGTSGKNLLKDLLAFDPFAQVVMVSADSARDNVLDAKSSGATWFLSKPLTQDKIVDALRKVPEFH